MRGAARSADAGPCSTSAWCVRSRRSSKARGPLTPALDAEGGACGGLTTRKHDKPLAGGGARPLPAHPGPYAAKVDCTRLARQTDPALDHSESPKRLRPCLLDVRRLVWPAGPTRAGPRGMDLPRAITCIPALRGPHQVPAPRGRPVSRRVRLVSRGLSAADGATRRLRRLLYTALQRPCGCSRPAATRHLGLRSRSAGALVPH